MANKFAVSSKTINDIYTAFNRSFNDDLNGLANMPDSLSPLAKSITTSMDTVKMPYFFDTGTGMNGWTPPEEKRIDKLLGGVLELTVTDYEKTFEVRLDDIESDNLGIYRSQVSALAQNVITQDDNLIASLLVNGDSTACYDGQNFFSNSHPTASGTQDNLLAGTLSAETLFSGITAMRKFTRYNGDKINIFPNTLVIPPDLEKTAIELMDSAVQVKDSASSDYMNYFKGRINNIIVTPFLTDANDWYLVALNQTAKPFIKIVKQGYPKMKNSRPDGDMAFLRNAIMFSAEQKMVIDYYAWQTAIKFTNA